jgi:enoyl reductase-like protein
VNIEMVLAEMQEALNDMDERPQKKRQGVELNWNEQFVHNPIHLILILLAKRLGTSSKNATRTISTLRNDFKHRQEF